MKTQITNHLTEDGKNLREEVFVKEQGFSPEIELDDIDNIAYHLVIYKNEIPVAAGRIFASDENKTVYTIGRVAVKKEYRRQSIGREILSSLEEYAKELGASKIQLHSQCLSQSFYEKCGYTAVGDIFYEELCPHIHMEKSLL